MGQRKTIYISCLFILLFLTSCIKRGRGDLPVSIGQPYEVLLEGDSLGIVSDILTDDIDGLPQAESLCNLIQVKRGKVKGSYLLMRTRVTVLFGKKFSVKLSHNENASPQTIIRISTESTEELRKRLNGKKLREIIDESELKHLAAVIQQNPKKQKMVKQLFGINSKIPIQLDATKKGKDFLWVSNNSVRGMQNLLFLKLRSKNKAKELTVSEIKLQIDSILRKNMIGETDEMYMVIPEILKQEGKHEQKTLSERGLWEMKNDAMGGPYVMKRKGNILVIGFVYAPEMKKRNLMKQLEAVLTTIN